MAASRMAGDVVTYTAVVSACEKAGEWEKALGVLGRMVAARVQGDVVVYNAVISAHAKGAQWQRGLLLLARMRRKGLQPDVVSHNSAISACAPERRWPRALTLLAGLQAQGSQRDAVSCNACATCCAGVWARAAMLLAADACKIVGYNALVSAYEKGSLWALAFDLWSGLSGREEADAVTHNSVICACDDEGRWPLAVHIFVTLPDLRVHPNAVACSAAISACEKGQQWELALALLATAPQRSVVAVNAAISACAKAACWSQALAALRSLAGAHLAPDVISFNAATFACQMTGRWRTALSLLAECGLQAVEPDLITFNTAILACEKPGRWEAALGHLDDLALHGWQGDSLTYNGLLRVCSQGRQWQRVLPLLSTMDESQLQGNAVAYEAAVRASEEASVPVQTLALLRREEGLAGSSVTFGLGARADEARCGHRLAVAGGRFWEFVGWQKSVRECGLRRVSAGALHASVPQLVEEHAQASAGRQGQDFRSRASEVRGGSFVAVPSAGHGVAVAKQNIPVPHRQDAKTQNAAKFLNAAARFERFWTTLHSPNLMLVTAPVQDGPRLSEQLFLPPCSQPNSYADQTSAYSAIYGDAIGKATNDLAELFYDLLPKHTNRAAFFADVTAAKQQKVAWLSGEVCRDFTFDLAGGGEVVGGWSVTTAIRRTRRNFAVALEENVEVR
ncbi:unnamed protein product [Symbiodinium natans]|uniref:Pentatricopeptide repeat-containing protein, chloroplastic n=1 Tax=Symbiodinium natans TaxID=878477 RepID=A0A812U5F1_9DINO|nr:unnamed protein product [Symbiodinium natans]